MSQSRSIRFEQVRLVVDPNNPGVPNVSPLVPPSRSRLTNWTPFARSAFKDPDTSDAVKTVPEPAEPAFSAFPLEVDPFVAEAAVPQNRGTDEPVDQQREDLPEEPRKNPPEKVRHANAEEIAPPSTASGLMDEADQKVREVSAVGVARSVALEAAFRAIADSVARISNDEANDRTGPWHFEMQADAGLLPMTTLHFELSPGELLLRFVSGDATAARLISTRKNDLRNQLLAKLKPPRSVEIALELA